MPLGRGASSCARVLGFALGVDAARARGGILRVELGELRGGVGALMPARGADREIAMRGGDELGERLALGARGWTRRERGIARGLELVRSARSDVGGAASSPLRATARRSARIARRARVRRCTSRSSVLSASTGDTRSITTRCWPARERELCRAA